MIRAFQMARGHAILVTDPAGLVTWVSQAAERLFRRPADEFVGGSIARIFVPEDIEAGAVGYEMDVARARGESDDDRWHLRADGSRFWGSGVLYAVRGEDTAVRAFVKVVRDRTDKREELETYQNRLAAAQEVSARRQLSLATLAHELRTPLGAVVHTAEVLRRRAEGDPAAAGALDVLLRQVGAMRELVHHLLDGLRADSAKIRLERRPIDLREVVAEAIDAVAPTVRARRHDLRVVTTSGPVPVSGDPARLRQVLVNLVDNAAKYTPDGGHLWVEAGIEGDEAVVRVVDDGQGIPPEMSTRIFELFTQVDPARGGLGIGLALVREIVELHGGTVQGNNNGPAPGSTFVVRLPLKLV